MCIVQLSAVITFLALKDITAVSWPTAGLAERHGPLSARALGLVAGAEVASALGRDGGAAASRGRVALGQDGSVGTGGHLQGRTGHPGTPQLL